MGGSERVIGIDPGSHNLGVGCVEKLGNQLTLVHTEVLCAPKSKSLFERLEIISESLVQILKWYEPTEVAVEDVFHAKNSQSAFHLGMARGIVFAACFGRGIKLFEYAPTQVKSVVTGYGRADKAQVKKMVGLILGVSIKENKYDATDALAVAICHASYAKLRARLEC